MSTPSDPLFTAFVALLIDSLVLMVPGSEDDTRETRRDLARLMFEAYQPKDAIEAMAAARAVAAHCAAMDSFNRAMRPGLSDDTVMRLRINGLAAGRSVEAALRARDTRRKEQEATERQASEQQPADSHAAPVLPDVRPASRRPSAQPVLQADPIVAAAEAGTQSESNAAALAARLRGNDRDNGAPSV
jgi:hypothetical protein